MYSNVTHQNIGLFTLITTTTIILSAVIFDTNALNFTAEPEGTGYYKRRDVVNLTCQVDSTNVEVVWFLNGNPLSFSSLPRKTGRSNKLLRTFSRGNSYFSQGRHYQSLHRSTTSKRNAHSDPIINQVANGSSLVFAPFRPTSNAGEYHCKASDKVTGESVLSKSVVLKKPVGPKQEFEEYMRAVEVIYGNNVVLNCTQPVHAEPAVYRWRYRKPQILRNFEDIETADFPPGRVVTTANGNLFLYNVDSSFAGDFRCATINELLNRQALTSYYYRLFVKNPKSLKNPDITHFPWFSSTVIEVGQTLTLECNAEGAPRPTVAWHFSAASTANNNRPYQQYRHKLSTEHEGILTIANASIEDSGTYACELEPAGSELLKTVRVTVVPPMSLRVSFRDDNNVNGMLDLTVGTNATLRCTTNRPLPKDGSQRVRWLKDGAFVTEELSGGIHQEVGTSEANLVIANTQLGDTGIYQCFLVDEQRVQTHSKSGRSFSRHTPFGSSADYYLSSSTYKAASAKDRQKPSVLIYSLHTDVIVNVTWPVTTSEAPNIITTTFLPEKLPESEAELADIIPPRVVRFEKQTSAFPSTIKVYWDFKLPSTHRNDVSSFSLEYCNISGATPIPSVQWEPSSYADYCNSRWHVGTVANASFRSAVVNVMPDTHYDAIAVSTLPNATSFVFRVLAQFKRPFFSASSGLLAGNVTSQAVVVEPVMPPGSLKAMAVGPDRIAAAWTDSTQLDALTLSLLDDLWYEVQWRPLGSSSSQSSANVYDVHHFSVQKPISSIKRSSKKIVPFVLLSELSPNTFYEIKVRYVRVSGSIVGHVDPVSPWSGVVHPKTALVGSPSLLREFQLSGDALAVAVSALFFPKRFTNSTTQSPGNLDGLFGASSELLYTVLGIIMGCLVITLIVFIVLCALRQKRQRKYIHNMRRQLNRMPSKENLNRLLTPSQLQHSGQKMRAQFTSPPPPSASLQSNGEMANGMTQFNASQHFQQQIGLFTANAMTSPAAAGAASSDLADSILLAEPRPKMANNMRGNAYGTMSRVSATKHMNGSALKSPQVAHNPYYRTLDSHRMFSNGGVHNKFVLKNGHVQGTNLEQQQPLLQTAESAFVDPPYELPSAVIAAAQQQRLILANQHAIAGLGGPPISAAAASSPASSVAQHYSTYSTFGRKNPLSTALNSRTSNTSNTVYGNGACPEGVALADMGVATNGIFISNGNAETSSYSGAGHAASIKSSSTSPSATASLKLSTVVVNNQASCAITTPPIGNHTRNGSCVGGQSTVSGSLALSDHNEEIHSNVASDVPAPVGINGLGRFSSGPGSAATSRQITNGSITNGAVYRPPPQLSFLT